MSEVSDATHTAYSTTNVANKWRGATHAKRGGRIDFRRADGSPSRVAVKDAYDWSGPEIRYLRGLRIVKLAR